MRRFWLCAVFISAPYDDFLCFDERNGFEAVIFKFTYFRNGKRKIRSIKAGCWWQDCLSSNLRRKRLIISVMFLSSLTRSLR